MTEPTDSHDDLLILDGGLATELEARGHDLDHPLWSAHLLESAPEAIQAVHRDYLDAGADCLLTASYQASFAGMAACGYSVDATSALMRRAVDLACQARDALWRDTSPTTRRRPLVAASIGPYGAYLADGSEFRGGYGVPASVLHDFHHRRLHTLWQAGPDLVAIETLPDRDELRVLLAILAASPVSRAWVSFSCRDGAHLHDGTLIRDAAALCAEVPAVEAVGINCTPPRHVPALIRELRSATPALRVLAYPNSGERFDGVSRSWVGTSDAIDFATAARGWRAAGATILGGCCRTTPQHIRAIRDALKPTDGRRREEL